MTPYNAAERRLLGLRKSIGVSREEVASELRRSYRDVLIRMDGSKLNDTCLALMRLHAMALLLDARAVEAGR